MPLSSAAAQQAVIAFQRFGLGAKPGGPLRIGASPKAALRAEINKPGIAAILDPTLPSYKKAAFESGGGIDRALKVREQEMHARFDKHLAVEIGFVERLVLFWSNHFSMSAKKGTGVVGMIGQFERDIIRKHVLGRFSDMLTEVINHPAMLFYLDNDGSISPNSFSGRRRPVSFTENLGREILDLHTVGRGRYSEPDVAALARMLTGWSYYR
ncbi:MAG: DUF1800 family protein, partial [Rhizobiales bacterium]|nr:DUF1800 family protein [Hyphomicrobiales bacterium]